MIGERVKGDRISCPNREDDFRKEASSSHSTVTVGKAVSADTDIRTCVTAIAGSPKALFFLMKSFFGGTTVLLITPFRTPKHFIQKQGCVYIK